MIHSLTSMYDTVWQFITADIRWVIGTLITLAGAIIAFASYFRGKQLELDERIVEAYEDDVDDSIAHRSFIQNVIKGLGTFAFLSWLFSDDDEAENDDE